MHATTATSATATKLPSTCILLLLLLLLLCGFYNNFAKALGRKTAFPRSAPATQLPRIKNCKLLLHYYPEEVLKLRPLLGLSAPCMHGALEDRTGNHDAQLAVVKFVRWRC